MTDSKNCLTCNKEFFRPFHAAGRRQWGQKKFCSPSCGSAHSYYRNKRVRNIESKKHLSVIIEELVSLDIARLVPFDSRYAATRDGRIFSRARLGMWREMSLFQRTKGLSGKTHLCVPLGWGNVWFVHRLVLETFVGPMPQGLQVRHLDGDPKNNHLVNLAYGSAKENAADRDRHGRTFNGRGSRK